jgi:pyruvate ferredoxin oxidoreductase gamma subunit
MKTAANILGSAFFAEGFEVQDAPRYGAERRGAPIFSYVRAARSTINERGAITRPDLVVVADDTLLPVPAAGILQGCTPRTVMLLVSGEGAEAWRSRLKFSGLLLVMGESAGAAGGRPVRGRGCPPHRRDRAHESRARGARGSCQPRHRGGRELARRSARGV